MRAKLAWVANTRPVIACAISMASTVTDKTFGPGSVKELNRITRHLNSTPDLTLKFPQLDQDSLRLTVYCDASFNKHSDHTSQLMYIILLSDSTDNCLILQFSSQKSRRVTRSTMAAETFAFADAFDAAFSLKHNLERLLGRHIPLVMLKDSQALVDVLTRAKYTTDKRLMIYVAASRQAYNNKEVDNIALIRSECNPADALTKIAPNDSLNQLIRTNKLSHSVEQFIIDC